MGAAQSKMNEVKHMSFEKFVKIMESQDQTWKDLVEMLYHRMPVDDLDELEAEYDGEEEEDEEVKPPHDPNCDKTFLHEIGGVAFCEYTSHMEALKNKKKDEEEYEYDEKEEECSSCDRRCEVSDMCASNTGMGGDEYYCKDCFNLPEDE